MSKKKIGLSVIIPFYNGNKFINDLIENIYLTKNKCSSTYVLELEVIIVNDSPSIEVNITNIYDLNLKIVNNKKNIGIHGSRVHGLHYATKEWVLFIDQDDLIISENFHSQLDLTDRSDVVVGNGFYFRNRKKELIYKNIHVMNYLINESKFLGIRNLIPSPGECLIKRKYIPSFWIENPLTINGADDWLLWLLLFDEKANFNNNSTPVYIHRTTESGNLSFDYEKMYASCLNMMETLEKKDSYLISKINLVRNSIEFKYLFDTNKIKIIHYVIFFDRFVANVIYKIITKILSYRK